MLHRAEVFLTPAEQEHREVIGRLFIETYCKLASDAVSAKQKLWRTRPKFHLFDHMVSDSRPSLLNPTFGSTWMDEDAIKRWFRIKKRVHKRNATLNCLRRWLLALPGQLQKACAKDNWDDFPKFSFWCGLKVKKNISFFLLDAPLTSLLVDPEKTLYTHMLGKKKRIPKWIWDGVCGVYFCRFHGYIWWYQKSLCMLKYICINIYLPKTSHVEDHVSRLQAKHSLSLKMAYRSCWWATWIWRVLAEKMRENL